MFRRVLISLFVMGVATLVWTEANAQVRCAIVGGTRVCWGGGSGGEIALVEISGREPTQACPIISGPPEEGECPTGCVPGGEGCICPQGGIGIQQVGPVVTEVRARAFGTVGQNCGFGGNEDCDFRGVVCCGDQAAPQCRHATFDGPLFARIVGGPGQTNDSAPTFTALRLLPTQEEQNDLCGLEPFITANAGKFFGEVCVEDTSGEECVRQFCIGNLGLGQNDAIIYHCKQLF